MINEGVIGRLHADLNLSNQEMVTEALWATSNLAADLPNVCKTLVQNEIFDRILSLAKSQVLKIRKEALITLSHVATTLDSVDMIKLCLSYEELLETLVLGLKMTTDQSLLTTLLDTIKDLCTRDQNYNTNPNHSFRFLLEQADVVHQLNELCKHPNA